MNIQRESKDKKEKLRNAIQNELHVNHVIKVNVNIKQRTLYKFKINMSNSHKKNIQQYMLVEKLGQ